MATLIFTIFISMAISALCSLLEACLLSLSLTDIAKISEKKIKVAKIWENFKKNIDKPIAVILIVNTLAHTIGAALSGAQFEKKFGGEWIWLFSLIYSLAMIQWTEILPKTMGVKYNRNLADIFALPLNLLVTIFKPVAFIIHLINKPFEGKKDDRNFDALSEINTLAHFAS
ncbi:MAG TPA: DUF21 domain-containing protein, partial [Spirochaetota bacterium]|nr:DUF21 domain-containing protein [Spirochaetota bacterium]